MTEKLTDDITPTTARFVMKLIQAYQGGEQVLSHVGWLLDEFQLRKGERLDNDRILLMATRAQEQEPETGAGAEKP